ncbi:MAG TPA: hypothetical protein VFR23_01355 [Jiangellaceae bacterium]|nr:hypothetical protein [Jiangellaceae bacterium]
MDMPVKLFTVIALISLPTVMFGGYSLLRLSTRDRLNQFQGIYFRAGHAHAGVLLVLALVVLDIMARSDISTGQQWIICFLLLVGILAQSGGMFIHMAIGEPGRWSPGNTVTTGGAVLLAVALIWVAVGVIAT